jgi:hypothetical protein
MSTGNCEAAIPELSRSLELAPNPSARIHLKRCEAELRDLRIAARSVRPRNGGS